MSKNHLQIRFYSISLIYQTQQNSLFNKLIILNILLKMSTYNLSIPEDEQETSTKVESKFGFSSTFYFNNLKNGAKDIPLERSTNPATDYRLIKEGLNLQGTCTNQDCIALNKRVWIPKGFGTFNMSKQIIVSVCRLCNKQAKDVNILGYYMGKLIINGSRENDNKLFKDTLIQNDQKSIKMSQEKGSICKWLFLQIDAEKL